MKKIGKLIMGNRTCVLADFENEEELERKISEDYKRVFGDETIYFDIKKE